MIVYTVLWGFIVAGGVAVSVLALLDAHRTGQQRRADNRQMRAYARARRATSRQQ